MADAVALDIAEAKRLLATATRPALKETLAQFISAATTRELELLTKQEDVEETAGGAPAQQDDDDDDDVVMVEEATADDAGSQPKAPAKTTAPEPADLLEPAPLKKAADEEASEETQTTARPPAMEVDAAIASPAPTRLAHGTAAKAQAAAPAAWLVPTYGWEQGEYNTPWVNIFVSIDDVGAARDRVTCDFTTDSFDLKAVDVNGRNYRLLIEALDKDIVPDESKLVVKRNRLVVKLKKVKSEYAYDHWSELKKKGGKAAKEKEKNKDPTAGIMDMMKDLYDNGDDNMRKIIGESMLKSRKGEKPDEFEKPAVEDDEFKMPKFGDFDAASSV